jgi:hypothetical protein
LNRPGAKQFSLYERDTTKIPSPRVIQYEGIYIFGGKNSEGDVKGNLYVLVIGKKPCTWINLQKYIDNESPSPTARYGHTMKYCSDLNVVVLFGGRNDSFGNTNK